MDAQQLNTLIETGESLGVEFKSDRRQVNDNTIYEEVVALANSEGGVLLIGVEDNATITGARPRHGKTTDSAKLRASIFNNTVPSINTRIEVVSCAGHSVIAIEVDPYPEPCATCSGKALRRIIGADGKPQSVPFYPRDQKTRRMDLGLLDFSAQRLDGMDFDVLDPLAFERIRQTIIRLRGDRGLLELSDAELAQALRLVETHHNRLVPNVAGMLLAGREQAIRSALPTHEVFFQVLDRQGDVKVNECFHGPLVQVLEDVEKHFSARNEERETTMGMFRLPVPDYSPEGFREAVNNAVLHRDYAKNEFVYIQWHPDHLLISSPGGFPEGVTVENLLVHEPKPRNPRLAEAFRRIGLIEQTGRGVDKIFLGQLRYGRPAPDYSRTDWTGVRVVLRGGVASLDFAAFVYEQDRDGTPLSLDELLILNALFFERRIDSDKAARLIQKGVSDARAVLERLHERDMVEARGERRGRIYHMSASLYRRIGEVSDYVRSRGFDRLQQRQLVLSAVQADGQIKRKQAAELCRLSEDQASRLLRKLCDEGMLEMVGKGRGAYYVKKTRGKTRGA